MSVKEADDGKAHLTVNSFSTRECDKAYAFLQAAFGDNMKVEAQGKPEDFAMRMTGAQFGGIKAGQV